MNDIKATISIPGFYLYQHWLSPPSVSIFVIPLTERQNTQKQIIILAGTYFRALPISDIHKLPKCKSIDGYEVGGILTAPRSDTHRDANKDLKLRKSNEVQCLHPGDLYPFTRKPLFIIVDSDNSYVFQHIPNHFGQPLVTLMSPLELPSSFLERKQNGSLFTLFLHSPLIGFCLCCDINTISQVHWEHAQTFVDNFMVEASLLVTKIGVDATYMAFFGDDFFRQLILRYIFCEAVLRAHRAFRGRTQLTRCSPILPDELFDNLTLQRILIDLAAHLQVRNLFHDPAMARQSPVQ